MKNLIPILFLSLAMTGALADTAERDAEFFHPAASLYIQGDATSSSNLVAKGLSIYPKDGKLLRLKELLENQQEQEQQQKDQEQQNQENQKQNEEQQNQENQENQNPPEPNEEQQQPPEPKTAEQMSEDEARQLLDAMRQEEKNKRMQLHPVLGKPVKVDKDW